MYFKRRFLSTRAQIKRYIPFTDCSLKLTYQLQSNAIIDSGDCENDKDVFIDS